jgi:hypothetical protein
VQEIPLLLVHLKVILEKIIIGVVLVEELQQLEVYPLLK